MCLLNFFYKSYPELHVTVSDNTFNCDCQDYVFLALYRYSYKKSHQLDRANCKKPLNLYDEKV